MNDFVKIRNSATHGQGLFALRDFQPGELVYILKKGKIVGHDEINNLSALEKLHLDKIGDNEFEVIAPPGCYLNHSCDPNVEERDHAGYALKPISKDQEITIDYDQISYLEKPFDCHCGAKNCRGIVKGKQ